MNFLKKEKKTWNIFHDELMCIGTRVISSNHNKKKWECVGKIQLYIGVKYTKMFHSKMKTSLLWQ